VKLEYVGEPNDNGIRTVFFKLNGQNRAIEIKDEHIHITKQSNRKVSGQNEVGAPLQGMISKIFVKKGDAIKKNTPLFTIEAMKMETTIVAHSNFKIKVVQLAEGCMVDADDMVIETED
jgi:pyruvate carboxylase